MEIAFRLTEEQWAEIYYAVDTKLKLVESGHYGNDPDLGDAHWAADLTAIKSKLEQEFKKGGVTY